MMNYLETKELHDQIRNKLHEKYLHLENETIEYTWDGPSDWQIYYAEKPRIMFLVKEARKGFHPDTPKQNVFDSKLFHNIARWKYAIKRYFYGHSGVLDFPADEIIKGTNDDIAIVEVKKLNEEKPSSSYAELCNYARADKEFLRQQIDIINPHVVVCCKTIDQYDIIYDEMYEPYEELFRLIQPSKNYKYVAWNLSNRLVLQFYHPSTRGNGKDNALDYLHFESISKLLDAENVQKFIQQIKSTF